jgi:hypothetical protein
MPGGWRWAEPFKEGRLGRRSAPVLIRKELHISRTKREPARAGRRPRKVLGASKESATRLRRMRGQQNPRAETRTIRRWRTEVAYLRPRLMKVRPELARGSSAIHSVQPLLL